MLLRESLTTALQRFEAASITPLRRPFLCARRQCSTVFDGGRFEEQTCLRRHRDRSPSSVGGIHRPHHRRHHTHPVELNARLPSASRPEGRCGRSRTRGSAHVLRDATPQQRQDRTTSPPSCSLSSRSTKKHAATRTLSCSLDRTQMLDAVLNLSSTLYEAEAVATDACADEAKASSTAADDSARSLQASRSTWSGGLGERKGEGATAAPEDAYASLDAEDLMDSMTVSTDGCREESESCGGQSDRGTIAPAPSPSNAAIASLSSVETPSSIINAFAAPHVPLERKVLQFMNLCSSASAMPHPSGSHSDTAAQLPCAGGAGMRVGDGARSCPRSSASTAWNLSAAAALVLPGLDMKAILEHGVLEHCHLRGLSLARCDFSLVRWSHVTLEDCDLSRSLFYQGELSNAIFRRCNFTGCILKGVQCSSSLPTAIRFEDCDFRLAAVGLRCTPRTSKRAGRGADQRRHVGGSTRCRDPFVHFLRCNFDLSDFQFSQGLDQSMFVKCSNTHLASRFPLRARGAVG
ncbi:hypothetical protein LSCM1_04075 [Leishmania martiniquensis]|uniref:Uncharacterized protein n=1 Tax=Leishmania martiniquensis TaxID=1580590 RepID=A0A836H7D8_9TRYP|nr:hypothetical protein LSCM1_04075 [Leishmania martiniquensis]